MTGRSKAWLSLPVGLALSVVITMQACGPIALFGTGLGPRVTASSVRSIRAGMTEAEVEDILGPPVRRERDAATDLVMHYARPALFSDEWLAVEVVVGDAGVSIVEVRRGLQGDSVHVYVATPTSLYEPVSLDRYLPLGS